MSTDYYNGASGGYTLHPTDGVRVPTAYLSDYDAARTGGMTIQQALDSLPAPPGMDGNSNALPSWQAEVEDLVNDLVAEALDGAGAVAGLTLNDNSPAVALANTAALNARTPSGGRIVIDGAPGDICWITDPMLVYSHTVVDIWPVRLKILPHYEYLTSGQFFGRSVLKGVPDTYTGALGVTQDSATGRIRINFPGHPFSPCDAVLVSGSNLPDINGNWFVTLNDSPDYFEIDCCANPAGIVANNLVFSALFDVQIESGIFDYNKAGGNGTYYNGAAQYLDPPHDSRAVRLFHANNVRLGERVIIENAQKYAMWLAHVSNVRGSLPITRNNSDSVVF